VLLHDRLVAIMSSKHRLANKRAIRIKDLGTESLIVLTASSELRERVAERFRRANVPLNVRVETETLASIKQMAARNMGVGIVPRMCVGKEIATGELIVKTVEEFRDERTLWLAYRRQDAEPSPVCQAFMKLTKAELKHHVIG
jgi:DNA-binding transcriptional LysR family regulator